MRIAPDWRRYTATLAGIGLACSLSTPLLAAMTGTVVLTPASVSASGIQLATLSAAMQTAQVQGVATVLDPQPLLTLAAHLQSVQARVRAADAAAAAAVAQAKRSQALYRHGENTSLRDMQAAQAAASAAQAQRMVARAEEAAARSGARPQWGQVLARMASSGPQALSTNRAEIGRSFASRIVRASISSPPCTISSTHSFVHNVTVSM